MSKSLIWCVVVALGVVAAGMGLSKYFATPKNSVRLVFTATVGDKPLVFNRFNYSNPTGGEKFRIRDFRFFLSNIRLHGKEGEFIEPDSYHLARFDSSDNSYSINLKNVELSELGTISLSIGVDAMANTSLEFHGDLDPNSRMAWNWEVGYKFILLEGGISINDRVQPLVYHVGFSENRRDLVFVAPEKVELGDQTTFRLTVDVMKIFSSKTKLDMTRIQKVVFDKADARMIADNYSHMISISW